MDPGDSSGSGSNNLELAKTRVKLAIEGLELAKERVTSAERDYEEAMKLLFIYKDEMLPAFLNFALTPELNAKYSSATSAAREARKEKELANEALKAAVEEASVAKGLELVAEEEVENEEKALKEKVPKKKLSKKERDRIKKRATTTAEEIVKPAEEIVKPAEEIVKPAEEIVKPAEEIVKQAEEIVKPAELKITDTYNIELSMGKSLWQGFMYNDYCKIQVSGIDYGFNKDGSLEELWSLSTSHKSLLSIRTCTTNTSTQTPILIVEEVSTFKDYLEELINRFQQKIDHSEKAWWPFIAEIYRTLFRDGVVALTYLYVEKKRRCGNLSSNFYVSKKGRGLILPGRAEIARKDDDINDFIGLMKLLLLGPFFEADNIPCEDLNIPADVLHFFEFAPFHRSLPLEYLLHHPSIWSFEKLIYYPARLKKMLYKRSKGLDTCGHVLNEALEEMSVFVDWRKKLEGVYFAIWQKGDPNKHLHFRTVDRKVLEDMGAIKVAAYKGTVSLVRYFAAAIQHHNDKQYDYIRIKELEDPEVVQELRAMFPDFYVLMYEVLGQTVAALKIGTEILAALGTIDEVEEADKFPKLTS